MLCSATASVKKSRRIRTVVSMLSHRVLLRAFEKDVHYSMFSWPCRRISTSCRGNLRQCPQHATTYRNMSWQPATVATTCSGRTAAEIPTASAVMGNPTVNGNTHGTPRKYSLYSMVMPTAIPRQPTASSRTTPVASPTAITTHGTSRGASRDHTHGNTHGNTRGKSRGKPQSKPHGMVHDKASGNTRGKGP